MRILGDSNITDAAVTATNVLSATLTSKLKTFQLTDNMRTITNSTNIDFTFNGTVPDIDCIGLCGTNLTATSVVSVSYSDTNIEAPDATVSMTIFSSLNQVIFLSAALSKKYWRVSITDTALSTLFVGYLYVGEYLEISNVDFGHKAELNIFSDVAVSPTGQSYGGKLYNSMPVSFTMQLDYDTLESYTAIVQEKYNVDPVLLIEFPESYALSLYRPKYGALTKSSIPYPMRDGTPLTYVVQAQLEERF